MTKQEIIDYVMTTPSNPNKAVLSSMLDSLVDGEGGGGSSRLLLYENDAITVIDEGAHWGETGENYLIYGNVKITDFEPPYYSINDTYTLEVDGVVCASGPLEFISTSGSPVLGLKSPGDTASVSNYSGGIGLSMTVINDNKVATAVQNYLILDGTKFAKGTHSVKLYKEV